MGNACNKKGTRSVALEHSPTKAGRQSDLNEYKVPLAGAQTQWPQDSIGADSSLGYRPDDGGVGEQLESVMESSYAVMGEQPLQVANLADMLDLAAAENKKARDLDANFWQDEMGREGAQSPDLMEMATLAEWVFHAELAYEVDAPVIRSCLAQCGMVLMQHSRADSDVASSSGAMPESPASMHSGAGSVGRRGGKTVAYYIAFDPSRRLAVLSIRGGPRSVTNIGEHLVAGSEPLGTPPGQPLPGWPAAAPQDWAHSGFAAAARSVVEDTAEIVQHLLAPQGYLLVLTGHSLGAGVASCAAKLLSDRGVPVQCYTFATPPCLDRSTALQCVGFITSVVHSDDAVPRASLRNVKMMGSIFQAANESRYAPDGDQNYDHQAILARGAASARLEPQQDMFVPGRVVFLYQSQGKYQAAAKNGTLSTLRRVELTPNCLADHICSEYIRTTVEVAGRLCGRAPEEFAPWKELSPRSPTAAQVSSSAPPREMQPGAVARQALQQTAPQAQTAPQMVSQAAPPMAAQAQGVPQGVPSAQAQGVLQTQVAQQTAPQAYPQSMAPSQLKVNLPAVASVGSLEQATPEQVDLQAIQGRWFHKEKLSEGGVTVVGNEIIWIDGHRTPILSKGNGVYWTTWKGASFRSVLQDGELRWNDGDVWVPEGSGAVFGVSGAAQNGQALRHLGPQAPAAPDRADAMSSVSESSLRSGASSSVASVAYAAKPSGTSSGRSTPATGVVPALGAVAPPAPGRALMPVPEEAPPGVLAGVQKAPSYLITWNELQKDPSLAAFPMAPAVAPDKVFKMQTGPGGVTRWVTDPHQPVPLVPSAAAPVAQARQHEQVRVVVPLPQQDMLSRTVFPQGHAMAAAAPVVAAK